MCYAVVLLTGSSRQAHAVGSAVQLSPCSTNQNTATKTAVDESISHRRVVDKLKRITTSGIPLVVSFVPFPFTRLFFSHLSALVVSPVCCLILLDHVLPFAQTSMPQTHEVKYLRRSLASSN